MSVNFSGTKVCVHLNEVSQRRGSTVQGFYTTYDTIIILNVDFAYRLDDIESDVNMRTVK